MNKSRHPNLIMLRGRPQKRCKNTSGLRNIKMVSPSQSSKDSPAPECDREASVSRSDGWEPHQVHDSLKPVWDAEGADSDIDEEQEWEDLEDPEFLQQMIKLAVNAGDDPQDETWLPDKQKKIEKKKKSMCDCKLAQYWGWCKYCYREVAKKNFEDAK